MLEDYIKMLRQNASYLLLTTLSFASSASGQNTSTAAVQDVFRFVNQLIGTYNGGNVFAGATLPFGMAKMVADVSGQNTAGFAQDNSNVTGFSGYHDSGTGGNPSMGNFPLSAQLFCPGDDLNNCKFGSKYTRAVNYKPESLKTAPGYFALALDNGISTEMTVSQHAGLIHFQFPASGPNGEMINPLMLLDLTDLQDSRQNATVKVDPTSGRIQANGTFLPSFGTGSYISHVCVDFKGAQVRDTGIFVNDRAGTEPKNLFVTRGINAFYIQAGSFVRFNTPSTSNTIAARVGLSFVSSEQACTNAENEIGDWDFQRLRDTADQMWRSKIEAVKVRPGGVSNQILTTFYSGIYRAFIQPQNYTGENPLWQSAEPYFDSLYAIWDTFRTEMPFLTLVDPMAVSEIVRSLIDTYKNLGWLPDCRMQLSKGFTQGGSNADVVIADAYVKNITGIDYALAYQAVKNDAENEPIDWSVEGRGGLQSWKRLNYIPYLDYDYLGFGTNSRSISRTLEYAYDDFCVATLAKGLGKMKDYQKYLRRSGNWMNIFKPDQTSSLNGQNTGFTGFFQPKYLNGTWGYQDPVQCSPLDGFCSLTSNPTETFESSIWEYQYYTPGNMAALVDTLGGPSEFVRRLDYLHTSGLLDMGNEPSFLTVFSYHYAGRPGLSAHRIHTYIPALFNDSATGLPGNDDSGAAGSFIAMSMSGLFPVAGQSVYLITPPFFKSVSYTNPVTGKVATIRNKNFDTSYKQIYIQSAMLDGKPYSRNWVSHDFFAQGRTLELTLGAAESQWGTRMEDLPPSLGAQSMQLGQELV